MLGILLVDKPQGITSHEAVNRVRRLLGVKRVGHAGTLDPLGTGLLVIAVGPATRFLQYLPLEPKVYECEFTFGVETDSQDSEGDAVAVRPVPADLQAQFETVKRDFFGLIQQLPPMFSAVKKDGKPLYKYARQGEVVERQPRTVHIGAIETLGWNEHAVSVRVECSGGTYMRTLAHDIGQKIGCGAHLTQLRRTGAGEFSLDDAVALEDVTPEALKPLADALHPMPQVALNVPQAAAIRQGQAIGLHRSLGGPVAALLDDRGVVIGVAKVQGNLLQPECVIPLEARVG